MFVLCWPLLRADLNPFENIWGILSFEIYKSRMTSHSLKELKETTLIKIARNSSR